MASVFRPLIRRVLPTRFPGRRFPQLEDRLSVRGLYTAKSLGIDKFAEQRQRALALVGGNKDKYFGRMRKYAESEDDGTQPEMVFTEDLKHVVQLSETDEDLDLCIKMMQRFHQQNKSLRFGTFVFGPIAIRLFYFLDKPDLALQVLKDPKLSGFFAQFHSYQIAMDLLYEKGRYTDVMDVFMHMRAQQLHGSRFPKDCVVLALAAAYQIGTKETYDFAVNLIREARKSGALVLRKGLTFAGALALKMNEPKVAMELLALSAQMNYVTVRNLRLIALSQLDRFDDIFLVLRTIIHEYHHLRQDDSEVCQDTLDRIQADLEKRGDKERLHLLSQIQRALTEGNHISKYSIDELLNRPMQHKSRDTNPPPAMFRDERAGPSAGIEPPRRFQVLDRE